MKILKNLFKEVVQKNRIDSVMSLLTDGLSVEQSAYIFERVKDNYLKEMAFRKLAFEYDVKIITRIQDKRGYNCDIDKPLN